VLNVQTPIYLVQTTVAMCRFNTSGKPFSTKVDRKILICSSWHKLSYF